MPRYTFIDVHVHAFREDCPPAMGNRRWASPADVLKKYDELGIEKGALMPLIGPEVYLPQSNEDILDMCRQSGGRFIPFCNIDPRGMTNSPSADFGPWLRHYRDKGCKGLGEVMPNLPFLDPRCQNLFAQVAEIGLPLTFDINHELGRGYGFYDDQGLPQLEQTLKTFPKLRIFGHGPAFWSEIGVLETPADGAATRPILSTRRALCRNSSGATRTSTAICPPKAVTTPWRATRTTPCDS